MSIKSRCLLLAVISALVSPVVQAAERDRAEPVVVKNTPANPVPVTGSVSATLTNPTIPVTGTVNANIINNPLHVTGSVEITAMPALSVGGFPESAFFGRLDGNGTSKAMGSDANKIGVTSILVTNSTAQMQRINFFNAVATDPTLCASGTAEAIGGASPYMYLNVEPLKTTQFTFPTPLVFTTVNSGGQTCIGSVIPAGVQLFVSGVLP